MGDLLRASRPFSWINTALPFLAAGLCVRPQLGLALILGTVYFLGPYNLLLYGVNDVFDYESDRLNPRKTGRLEGGRLGPEQGRRLALAIVVTNAPLLLAVTWLSNWEVGLALAITVLVALAYSAPPLRTKVIPGLDSLTSALHFVLPAGCGLLVAGLTLSHFPWLILAAFGLWGMASQALGAIQDLEFDRRAGIGSIATAMGARRTATMATAGYLAAVLLLAADDSATRLAAVLLLPYVALAASCLAADAIAQARRAWRGFLALNLLVGFFLTQLLLQRWGVERFSALELLALGSALMVAASLANLVANEVSMRRRPLGIAPEPAVSLIVAVPDGTSSSALEACLRSIGAQSYTGPLEVITVFGDGASPPVGNRNLRSVMAGPAPSGWTSRCWLAHRGAAHALADVLVFMAADSQLAAPAVARAVAELTLGGAAMVSWMPRFRMRSRVERALVPALALGPLCWLPIAGQNRARRWTIWPTAAAGSLMAITKAAYRAAGGHARVSSEVLETAQLGRLVAAAGGRVRFRSGSHLVLDGRRLGLGQVAPLWRRGYYRQSGDSLGVALAGMVTLAAVQLLPLGLPFLAWASGDRLALATSLAALGLLLILRIGAALWERQPLSTLLWHPITWLMALGWQLLSMLAGLRGQPGAVAGLGLSQELVGLRS